MSREVVHSICRACVNQCSIDVVRDGDDVLEVRGNPLNPVFRGYTCVKGRAQPALLRHRNRLLAPLRRRDGRHVVTSSAQALDDIASRLAEIVDDTGPRSVASYWGTMVVASGGLSMPFHNAFMDAIGSSMRFDPNTIDKGGKHAAASYLGHWGAPSQGFDAPEAILLLGVNPWLTITGFPSGAPARWLLDQLSRGCRLIVVDPRKTEVAARADWFLQIRPGTDVLFLASMIKIIICEELFDEEFVSRYTRGMAELTAALEAVDLAGAAHAMDVSPDSVAAAARCYASASRGYAMAGTGPNMSGAGTLIEYLVLVLETLCGRWLREGEVIRATPTLLPTYPSHAQAHSPEGPVERERLRVRGLTRSAAGMPTAALAEEILTPGEGRVRALISWAGNPVLAFPDQRQTVEALESLDLFVQVDPWYSETARLADYVLPTTLPLEVPGSSLMLDWMSSKATGYGLSDSYAQYTPAVTSRPEGSDLLEEWEIFWELMQRMDVPVAVRPLGWGDDLAPVLLEEKPTADELIELFSAASRVPLEAVKEHPGGQLFPDGLATVLPPQPGHRGRLDIASAPMIDQLTTSLDSFTAAAPSSLPFRLLCRRANHTYNSSYNVPETNNGVGYNPAFMNPRDMADRHIVEGGRIGIRSATGRIEAFAHADEHLRRGCVSMTFAYGAPADRRLDPAVRGSSVNQLLRTTDEFDPFTGQPRMSNVPVDVVSEPDL